MISERANQPAQAISCQTSVTRDLSVAAYPGHHFSNSWYSVVTGLSAEYGEVILNFSVIAPSSQPRQPQSPWTAAPGAQSRPCSVRALPCGIAGPSAPQ